MQTMDLALERLLTAGKITAEGAIEKASDKDSFPKFLAESPERPIRQNPASCSLGSSAITEPQGA